MCQLTIDTGSNISIIRPDVLCEQQRSQIQPVSQTIRTVTGEKAPIRGKGWLHIKIGSQEVQHPMWVADIQDDCILGLDFLQLHRCVVNVADGILLYKGEEVPLQRPGPSPPRTYRAVLDSPVSLPPYSESVATAQVDGLPQSSRLRWGIMEPAAGSKEAGGALRGLLLGRTLVDLHIPSAVVRLLNPTGQRRKLKKGTEVARCELVESVCVPQEEAEAPEASPEPADLPAHLQELYKRSTAQLSSDQSQQVYSLLQRFSNLFSSGPHDIGKTDVVKHTIDSQGAAPIRQPPRRLPATLREEAQRAVADMLRQGLIEPSASPWASPVVLVRKKDGSSRFCVDYRRLNGVTRKDSYPLPRIDDTLDRLAGMEWFSTLDLKSGYWQVEMDKGDKEKTAFVTSGGLWQFVVMPFGLCNAPATFERLMDRVLGGLPPEVALVYLDDILVSGKTFQQQIDHLEQVFQRLVKARLKLSPGKCYLFRRQVKYLGHTISSEGVSTSPEKVNVVAEWPVPTCITELRRFLGLCSYYRRFIFKFADIAAPLHSLTQKQQPFVWTPERVKAFRELRRALVEAPVLGYPLPEGDFILDTDASNEAVGAVLCRMGKRE